MKHDGKLIEYEVNVSHKQLILGRSMCIDPVWRICKKAFLFEHPFLLEINHDD